MFHFLSDYNLLATPKRLKNESMMKSWPKAGSGSRGMPQSSMEGLFLPRSCSFCRKARSTFRSKTISPLGRQGSPSSVVVLPGRAEESNSKRWKFPQKKRSNPSSRKSKRNSNPAAPTSRRAGVSPATERVTIAGGPPALHAEVQKPSCF